MKQTPLAIIEEHSSIRQTYATYLCAQPEFDCVLVVGSVDEFLARLPSLAVSPCLVLSNVGLPAESGTTGVARIRRVLPGAEVVLITVFNEVARVFEALRAGAVSYLLKSASLSELKAGLLDVLAGGSPMSPALARHVVRHYGAADGLTDREQQLVRAIKEGLSYKLVAERLDIPLTSVRPSIRQIYDKLQVPVRPALAVRGQ